MLVAVSPAGTVIDTAILSMSETAGQGTKIEEKQFRDQFKNKSKDITLGTGGTIGVNSIDTIAGATISSKAFLNGVNSALAVVSKLIEENSITSNNTENEGSTDIPDITDTTNISNTSDTATENTENITGVTDISDISNTSAASDTSDTIAPATSTAPPPANNPETTA
jgi:hypothetical protein